MWYVGPDGLNAYLLDWWPRKPLGEQRKRFGVLLILLGVCTLFLPMIVLDSPVLKRTEWSALNIASKVYEGKLPLPGGSFDLELIAMAVIYLLMPFALLALYRPGPPKALNVISCVGVVFDMWLRRGPYGMDVFGWECGHMRTGPAWWILPWIMPALLAICFAKNLDGRSGAQEKEVS